MRSLVELKYLHLAEHYLSISAYSEIGIAVHGHSDTRTKNVKYHQGVGGIGLRWPVKIQPLGSATEDKGCGHKGPGRKSSLHDHAFKLEAPLFSCTVPRDYSRIAVNQV